MTREALELVAARFKVLAEPLRLQILQLLKVKEMSVSEITERVESTQPNISKHLKIMQQAGLIGRKQEGNTVYYSISDSSVFELCEVVCSSLHEQLKAQATTLRQNVRRSSNKNSV
jgi:DNA-binding transcriptional ArsR family regulator